MGFVTPPFHQALCLGDLITPGVLRCLITPQVRLHSSLELSCDHKAVSAVSLSVYKLHLLLGSSLSFSFYHKDKESTWSSNPNHFLPLLSQHNLQVLDPQTYTTWRPKRNLCRCALRSRAGPDLQPGRKLHPVELFSTTSHSSAMPTRHRVSSNTLTWISQTRQV